MFSFLKPKPKGISVTPSAIYDAIKRDHGHIFASTCTIRLADTNYLTVTTEQAQRFVDKATSFYIPEINDCDDQAWMAKAYAIQEQVGQKAPLAFGVLWTEDHALNWYMDYGYKIRLIDQQQHTGRLTPATLWLA